MAEESLKSSADFLKQISSFSEQIKINFKDVYSAVDDLKTKIGTDLFDPSDAEQYLNAVKELEDEMTKFATSITGNLAKTIVKDFDKMINEVKTFHAVMLEDLIATKNFNTMETFANRFSSSFSQLSTIISELKQNLGTDLFDTSSAEDLLKIIVELKQQMQEVLQSTDSGLSDIMKKDLQEMLDKTDSMADKLQKTISSTSKINDNIKVMKEPFNDLFDSFTTFIDKIPIVGSVLKKTMNLDSIKDKLQQDLSSAFSNISEDGKASVSAINSAFLSTFSAMAKTITNMMRAVLLNPWLLAVVGVVLLINKFVDLEKEAQDFREATGQSYKSSLQLTKEIESSALAARMFGVEMQDVFGSAQSLISVIGSSKLITGQMATDLAVLSKITGITSDNAAGVYKQFAATGRATSKSAIDMANTLAYTSQLMGVPMDVMFADVAESGEFIAQYMGQTNREISKTAVQARLLGLTMKDVESITSSIMDFEGSIEKELMASILVGKQLNFNYARQLAFNGKVGEATKEVMRQVGTLDEFNKLNPIAAKSLADAAGLTVEKLRDSLYTQKLIATAEGDYKKELQRAQDILDGTIKMSEAERMAQDRANLSNRGALKELSDAWGQIGASLTKIVLPAIQGISFILKGLADFILLNIFAPIDSLTNGTDSWVNKLLKAVWVILMIAGALLSIKLVLGSINILTSKILSGGAGGVAGGAGGRGGGFLGKIFGGLSNKSMLSGAASILIMSGAIWVFAKALQELQKNDKLWETLTVAIIGLVALASVARLLGQATPEILVGSLAIGILAGALWVLGKAINEFVPYIKVLIDGIVGFADVIGKTIVNIIGAVTDSFVKLGNIDAGNLLAVAAAIGTVGLAMGSFGATGIFAAIGGLATAGLIDQFVKLSTLGPGLMQTAQGIQATRLAMEGKPIPEMTVPQEVNVPVNASTSLNETITNGDNLIIEKLNQLIEAVNKQDIYLDGRKVNTNLGRSNYPSKLH